MVGKSRRKRKRHVQQELFRRGGKRRGAGRKPKAGHARERHEARPDFKPYHPLHVVMRVVSAVGSLRRREMYKAVRDASITAALRERFRVVPVRLQRDHVPMLVGADDKEGLGRGEKWRGRDAVRPPPRRFASGSGSFMSACSATTCICWWKPMTRRRSAEGCRDFRSPRRGTSTLRWETAGGGAAARCSPIAITPR